MKAAKWFRKRRSKGNADTQFILIHRYPASKQRNY